MVLAFKALCLGLLYFVLFTNSASAIGFCPFLHDDGETHFSEREVNCRDGDTASFHFTVAHSVRQTDMDQGFKWFDQRQFFIGKVCNLDKKILNGVEDYGTEGTKYWVICTFQRKEWR